MLVAEDKYRGGREMGEVGLKPVERAYGLGFAHEYNAPFGHHGIGMRQLYHLVDVCFCAIHDVKIEISLILAQHSVHYGVAQTVDIVVLLAHQIIDGSNLLRLDIAQDFLVGDGSCCHREKGSV